MPQKSTYFFPKLLTGVAFHPLVDGERGGPAGRSELLARAFRRGLRPDRGPARPAPGGARRAVRPRGGRRHHGAWSTAWRRTSWWRSSRRWRRAAHAWSARSSASATVGGGGPPVVVLDPIDGSLNANRGLPVFATSIALADGPDDGRRHARRWCATTAPARSDRAERGGGASARRRRRAAAGAGRTARWSCCWSRAPYPGRVALAARGARRARRPAARAGLAGAVAVPRRRRSRCDAMAGLGRGRSVDVAAAQLVAREAGLRWACPGPDDLPGDAARPDDPLPRAGRPRPRRPWRCCRAPCG